MEDPDQDDYDPSDACQDDSSLGIQSSAGDLDQQQDEKAPAKPNVVRKWLNELSATSSNRSLGWGNGRLTKPAESATTNGGCSENEAEMEGRIDDEGTASTRDGAMVPDQGVTSPELNGVQEEKDEGRSRSRCDGHKEQGYHDHHRDHHNEGHQYYSNGSRSDVNRRRGSHRRDRRREYQDEWEAMQDSYFEQQSRERRQSRSRSRDRVPHHQEVSRDGHDRYRSRSKDLHERRDKSRPAYESTSRREHYRSRGEEDYWERRDHGSHHDSWDGSSSSRSHQAPNLKGRGPSSSSRDDRQRMTSRSEDHWDRKRDVPHHEEEEGEKDRPAVEQGVTDTSTRSGSQGKAARRSRPREMGERELRPCKKCRLLGQSDNGEVPPTLLLPPPPSPEDVEAVRKYFEDLRKRGLVIGASKGESQAESENGDKKAKKRKKAVNKDRVNPARRPPPAYAGSSTTSSSPVKRKSSSSTASHVKGKNSSSTSSPVKGKNNKSQPVDLKSLSRAQKKFYKDISTFVKKVLQTYLQLKQIKSVDDMDFLAKKMTYKIYVKEHGNTEMSVETTKKITKYIKGFFQKQPVYSRNKEATIMPWAAREFPVATMRTTPTHNGRGEQQDSRISWADGERPYPIWYGSIQPTNIQALADDPESARFVSLAPTPDRRRSWSTRVLESCTTTVVLVGTVLILVVLSVTLVFALVKSSRRSQAHTSSSSTTTSSSSLSHLTYGLPTGLPNFSALCEDKMADLGKNFTSDNMQLLDCIQRTGMDNTAGRSCFDAAPPGPQRDALYKCSVCKGCTPALPKEKDTLCRPHPPTPKPSPPVPAKATAEAPHTPVAAANASTTADATVAQPLT